MAAWGHWHTLGEAERKRRKCMGWCNAPRKRVKGGATEKGKATLSCRREGSPLAVIVMRAWLAVKDVPPEAFASKRSCLSLPRLARAGQVGLGAGTRDRQEWSQVQIHARRVLHPAAFPADQTKMGKMSKTVLAVQHKHIKEVPTTMAVSLVTLWSSWAFLRLCHF